MEYEIFETTPENEKSIGLDVFRSVHWQIIEAKTLMLQVLETIKSTPKNVFFKTKVNEHDFGKYVTLELHFDYDDEEHRKFYQDFFDNIPDEWTEKSKETLKKFGHPFYIGD